MKKIFIFILLFFMTSDCFAVTQLKKTVKPSGGDYTSLEACVNANEQNLVTADKYLDVEIDGSWSSSDTTAVTVHNYTTNSTHYVNIYTTSTARHLGVWSSSKYNLSTSDAFGTPALTANSSYVTVTGLQIKHTPTMGYGGTPITSASGASNVRFDKCIFVVTDNYSGNRSRMVDSGNFPIKITNSIGYSSGTSLSDSAFYSTGQFVIYNTTMVGFDGGIITALGGGYYKNNICQRGTGAGQDCFGESGNKRGTFATNLSSDGTGEIANKTLTFVNKAGWDLHLASSDTFAIDAGTNLSADGQVAFSDDIDGDSRPQGTSWDIGADEYIASGGSADKQIHLFNDEFNRHFDQGLN